MSDYTQQSYEYTLLLVEEALRNRDYNLYKEILGVFYQNNKEFSHYFGKSYAEKLKDFIELYNDEFYQYGFDFHIENETKYGVYSSGMLVAYFDVFKGLEIFIDEKINDLANYNIRKEKIKSEINKYTKIYNDLKTILLNPDLMYNSDSDYLLINNPFKVDNKRDYVKVLKKESLLVENYLKHLEDMIHMNNKLLDSFQNRFKNLNDFSYALADLENKKQLLLDLIVQYVFVVDKNILPAIESDRDIFY